MIYGALLYLVFFAALELFPAAVLQIFDASDYMLEIGIPALRIFALVWFIGIPGLVMAAALQGLSMGFGSMMITMTRQAILPLLFAVLLRTAGNLNLIWAAFVIAEAVGIPLALTLWKNGFQKALTQEERQAAQANVYG